MGVILFHLDNIPYYLYVKSLYERKVIKMYDVITINHEDKKKERMKLFLTVGIIALITAIFVLCVVDPTFADVSAEGKIKEVLTKIIKIIGLIFQSVGVVLSVYSIGALILAFKNEDADSKSRASTMLVVGVVLIAVPLIINELNLIDYIGS